MDLTHLNALNVRLSHERGYLAAAKSNVERDLRSVWISQIEKEISDERTFLGLGEDVVPEMSDDDLLALLSE